MKENCSSCGNDDFAIARDMRSTRICKCGHKWLPMPPMKARVPNVIDELSTVFSSRELWTLLFVLFQRLNVELQRPDNPNRPGYFIDEIVKVIGKIFIAFPEGQAKDEIRKMMKKDGFEIFVDQIS